MKHVFNKAGMLIMLVVAFISCEKVELPIADNNDYQPEDGVNITFTISQIEQVSFDGNSTTRASTPITDLCSRITFAFFKDGTKAKQVSQKSSDDDFGSLQVSLPAGTYQFVVMAHNGSANPTVTSPEEISFGNNGKLADTFYYYGELDATESKDLSLTLKRAVAMIRFITTDAVPADVSQMQFNYTGGSSSFNAVTGLGCKNSRQEETFDVATAAHSGQSQYDLYTFPHDEMGGAIKLTVTALMDNDEEYKEEIFTDVPVKTNQITKYTGAFFANTQKPGEVKISLYTDADWTEESLSY